jgi:hypothetical protein
LEEGEYVEAAALKEGEAYSHYSTPAGGFKKRKHPAHQFSSKESENEYKACKYYKWKWGWDPESEGEAEVNSRRPSVFVAKYLR